MIRDGAFKASSGPAGSIHGADSEAAGEPPTRAPAGLLPRTLTGALNAWKGRRIPVLGIRSGGEPGAMVPDQPSPTDPMGKGPDRPALRESRL